MVELAGGRRRRIDEQGGGDLPFHGVGGLVRKLQIILAFILRKVGGGAAAVQVQNVHAAEAQHDGRKVVVVERAGNREVSAVNGHDDHGAVRLHAHRGVRRDVVVLDLRDGLALTVCDQHIEAGDGFLQGAQRCFVKAVAQHDLAVLGHAEVGLAEALLDHGAVHDQHAAGLAGGHVEDVGVHGGNDVAAGLFLRLRSLLAHGLHLPHAGRVIVGVAGHQTDGRSGVDGHGINHFLPLPGGIVRDDPVLLHAGGYAPLRIGDEIGVLEGDEAVIGIRRDREGGEKQGERQQDGQPFEKLAAFHAFYIPFNVDDFLYKFLRIVVQNVL